MQVEAPGAAGGRTGIAHVDNASSTSVNSCVFDGRKQGGARAD